MRMFLEASVPLVGWLAAPIGLGLMLAAPRWLYFAMVFAIPFSATTVVNFGASPSTVASDAFGVQVAIFFGVLWISRELFDHIRYRTLADAFPLHMGTGLLGAFLAIVGLSLFMPFVIDGDFLALSQNSQSFAPLTASVHNLSQTVYLVYGCLLAVLIAARCHDARRRYSTLKAYVVGGIALAIWGYMQFVVVRSGHTYPHGLLNTNVQPQTRGYQEFLEFEGTRIPRISSAAVEPSLFAQTLLTMVPIIAVAVLRHRPIFSMRVDIATLALLASIMLLSTSTTAYVGSLFLIAAILMTLDRARRLRYFVGLVVASVATSFLYFSMAAVRTVIDESVFAKLESWSATQRLSTVRAAWWHFVEYPILGTGWGSAPANDLVIFLLANTGVIGLAVFAAFVGHVLVRLMPKWRVPEVTDRDLALAAGVRISLLALLFVNALTGFAFVFGHFWLMLGLALACGDVLRKTRPRDASAARVPRTATDNAVDGEALALPPVRSRMGLIE